jgi:hypothetical protein
MDPTEHAPMRRIEAVADTGLHDATHWSVGPAIIMLHMLHAVLHDASGPEHVDHGSASGR